MTTTTTTAPVRRRSLSLESVSIADAFWSPRREVVRHETIPHQHAQLRAGGQLDALKLQWKPGDPKEPHPFWESDVAKWIEAASYTLATHPDAELDRLVDEAIELLAGAQQSDGYLDTYFLLVKPEQRFLDLQDAHELYGAGHLIEAGVAHYQATGKTTLLAIVRRLADMIDRETGPGGRIEGGYDGHEEIELALVRLAEVTGERKYLELSARLVDSRGADPYYFDVERKRRGTEGWAGEAFWDRPFRRERYREYSQAHRPVREQHEAVGHAVRAMYLYSAMADLARELDDVQLKEASEALWNDVVSRKLYVTGGLGSDRSIEGFGGPYDLPDDTAYAETCASVGLVFWAHRMMVLTGEARYVDVLERALYNGVLSGTSRDGKHYFYQNPLASGADHRRQEWFGTACCPPNLARLLSSLEKYVYVRDDDGLYVNLFAAGSARLEVGGTAVLVSQRTAYPWKGDVTITVDPERVGTRMALRVRVPQWAHGAASVALNGTPAVLDVVDGYVVIDREWRTGDRVELDLPMRPARVHPNRRIRALLGRVALQRGPLVYCVEDADNEAPVTSLSLREDTALRTEWYEPLGVERIVAEGAIELAAAPASPEESLYSTVPPRLRPTEVRAVPYFAWANRQPGSMEVWMTEGAVGFD